jgi:hypothetical protein
VDKASFHRIDGRRLACINIRSSRRPTKQRCWSRYKPRGRRHGRSGRAGPWVAGTYRPRRPRRTHPARSRRSRARRPGHPQVALPVLKRLMWSLVIHSKRNILQPPMRNVSLLLRGEVSHGMLVMAFYPKKLRQIANTACCLLIVGCIRSSATACPFCSTDIGMQVNAKIFGDDFVANVAAIASPFPILLACVFAVCFGWPSRQRLPLN